MCAHWATILEFRQKQSLHVCPCQDLCRRLAPAPPPPLLRAPFEQQTQNKTKARLAQPAHACDGCACIGCFSFHHLEASFRRHPNTLPFSRRLVLSAEKKTHHNRSAADKQINTRRPPDVDIYTTPLEKRAPIFTRPRNSSNKIVSTMGRQPNDGNRSVWARRSRGYGLKTVPPPLSEPDSLLLHTAKNAIRVCTRILYSTFVSGF